MPYQKPQEDTTRAAKLEAFDRLLTIMDELRLNCPWDQKQTLETIRPLTIEETYELSDAIIDGDIDEVKKELGDIMLHLVFYSKIASEKKQFDITDVLNGICDKMINRHPHVYGDVNADDEEAVKQNWEKIKIKEGSKGVLSGVPKTLPSMDKAVRIQAKARGAGFDWDKKEQVWEKVEEELQEYHDAPTQEEKEKEFGDLLFSLINYARFEKIDPSEALERTNKKFIKRFNYLEKHSKGDGKSLSEMTLEEMDEYWNRAKKFD